MYSIISLLVVITLTASSLIHAETPTTEVESDIHELVVCNGYSLKDLRINITNTSPLTSPHNSRAEYDGIIMTIPELTTFLPAICLQHKIDNKNS